MPSLLGWWEQLTGAACPGCSKPLKQPTLCTECRSALVPKHVPGFLYLGSYQRFGSLSRAIKYQGRRNLAVLLGQKMALGVRQADWDLDGVTAVPTLLHRRLARGYNQAELLAQSAAKELQVPYKAILLRSAFDKSQTEKTPIQRLQLSEATFKPTSRVQGTWLLVDDVVTTGTTFKLARKTLLEAGAARVFGAAIAVKSPHELSMFTI